MLSRLDYVKVDELGMDPLRDNRFDAIRSVQGYELYTVDTNTRCNPQLISDMYYRTVELWDAILYYNGLADNFQLKEGMRIKIPNINELTSALSALNSRVTIARI